ncbi:hypothetical protein C8J57DRAFT_1587861 [Mycena rebaudengoi]|nr:hypothetical protein C8J57DRAFT_1587861 [Mycena rebaudengoi]
MRFSDTFLLMTMAAATTLAQPGQIARCAAADDKGGALIKSRLEPNGQFVDCFYTIAGLCAYFAFQGTFSSGSSICPDSIGSAPVDHLVRVGLDGLTYTPSSISAAVGDTVTFEFHPNNHTVTQSSFEKPCVPLETRLGFKSGFQPVATNANTFPKFQITINDTQPIWGYCGQKDHCSSGMVFAINAVENGPNNFAAFQARAKATATAPGTVSSQCVAKDDNGGSLLSSSVGPVGFVTCKYSNAGTCKYFDNDGSFSSGSSVCPDRINASTGSAPPPQNTKTAQCVAKDDNGGSLLSSSVGPVGFVTCKYSNAGTCKYFDNDGSFSSGSSVCPDSITPASRVAGTFLAGDNSNSTGSSSGNSQPILIALLAINGVLAVAVIGLATLYLRERRSSGKQMRGKYTTVVDPASITLRDHSAYDPHDRK